MTIHLGLVGGGNITETHARAARAIPNVQIAAICGTNSEKVARLCRDYDAKPYSDLNAFFNHRPMQAVVLGSPSGLHAEQGIAAAQHGLHILTEKPIDICTQRADALIQATQRAGVKLAVIFQDRCKPNIQRLKHWLDSGLFGKPILVDARVKWYRPPEYYSASKWRGTFALDGGGALINQAIHTVDLLLWLLGDVTRVQARTATLLHKIETEDTVVATLEFASGAVGTFLATTASYPGYPRRLEITGTQGTVILEHDCIIAADLRNPPPDLAALTPGDSNQSANSAAVTDIAAHQAIIENFLQAVGFPVGTQYIAPQRSTQLVCDGPQGRRSLALVESIYQAARTSQ